MLRCASCPTSSPAVAQPQPRLHRRLAGRASHTHPLIHQPPLGLYTLVAQLQGKTGQVTDSLQGKAIGRLGMARGPSHPSRNGGEEGGLDGFHRDKCRANKARPARRTGQATLPAAKQFLLREARSSDDRLTAALQTRDEGVRSAAARRSWLPRGLSRRGQKKHAGASGTVHPHAGARGREGLQALSLARESERL